MMLPLGPEAIRARIESIRSQMRAAFPVSTQGFQPALSGAIGEGASEPTQGSVAPMNPFSGQVQGFKGREAFRSLILEAAHSAGIDADLLDSVVQVESDYDPLCKSRAGAMGLTQLMPSNCQEYGVANPYDPRENLRAGARHLADMIRKHPGNLELALASYNAGPGAVAKYGGIPPYRETQNYVRKVLGAYQERKSR